MSGYVSNPAKRLKNEAVAATIPFRQTLADAIERALVDKAGEVVSVEDFTADVGTGGDDTAAIQKAIDRATGVLLFTRQSYRVDGQITWKNSVIYQGCGVNIFGVGGTKITFNATDQDASVIVNPLNASTPANISFRDLYLYAPNLQAEKAVIADTGSSYVAIDGCRFYSSGDCLHLDQSEIWRIEKTSFLLASATSVGIWLINGPDKQVGSLPYFTNQITVNGGCDFNGAAGAVAIRDDGGVSHTFENNNYNGCGSHIIATGVNGLKIDGGEFEESSGQSIICGTTKRKGGAGAKSTVVSINRAYLYNNADQPALAMVAGAVGHLELTNNTFNTPGDPCTGLAVACDEIDAHGNVQVGAGLGGARINNRIDVLPCPVDWWARTTSPTLGNGTIAGNYSRRGRMFTMRQQIVMGTTTQKGEGGYLFPLSFPADPAVVADMGSALLTIVGVGFYTACARITSDGATVELFPYNATNPVGATVPWGGGWPNGSSIELQITYVTKDPI